MATETRVPPTPDGVETSVREASVGRIRIGSIVGLASTSPPAAPRRAPSAPLLVLRGREDRILSKRWARELARRARDGRVVEMPGAHSFPGSHPHPVRRLALEVEA